ncbi:response regulator receiver domain-containing protein [Chitinophaga niastensis]|uniref:Response regulator receiver domain-containing protein n=1 Tax=Chitinophaga niastensis TaxID=536980 RepID=A0A2P8HAA2_CHINA|nr:response regulator [Chitinophaga niastensis]PSL43145.1 response regulator receiver domain-containing protein [Chitinophaga niastensis]
MDTKNDQEITTLLLVDDDPDDQELFKLALTEIKRAVSCVTASNGQDALDQLTTRACAPDLIFLDMNMPMMNGLTFLGKIKEIDALKRIPVIIYSTSNEPREISAAKKMGASDFITKPTKFADLCQLLHHILLLHINV